MPNQNFKRGHGRLGTDRFDFQKHINGEDFRQKASTVDLDATLTHMGTTVEDALLYLEANSGGGGGGVVNLSNLSETTGILPIVRGGTGLNAIGSSGTVFTSTGSAGLWQQIVNANVSNSAAIGVTKLAAGSSSQVLTTSGSTPTWSTIVNANISSSAAISVSKLASGSDAQVLTTVAGVPTWAAPTGGDGYGATSVGSSGQVQTADGLGGFLAPSNVFAGSNYISVGATPSTAGLFRVPYSAGNSSILGIKDALGTNRTLIQFDGVTASLGLGDYGIFDTYLSAKQAIVNASLGLATYVGGIIKQNTTATLTSSYIPIAFGVTPATSTAWLRFPYDATYTPIIDIKDSGGTNRGILGMNGGNAITVGSYGTSDMYLNGASVAISASTQGVTYINNVIKQVINSSSIVHSVPQFGFTTALSPYGHDGAAHIPNAASPTYTLLPGEYCFFAAVLYHSGGGTYIFPSVSGVGGYQNTYFKWVENLGASTKTISNNGTLGFTVALPPNSRRLLKFNSEGVVVLDSGSSGASSVGSSGQVQTADGTGYFSAPSNVFAGTNYLSIGSNPAQGGLLRLPSGVGNLISMRNLTNTANVTLISGNGNAVSFGANLSHGEQSTVTTLEATSGGAIYFYIGNTGGVVIADNYFGSHYPRHGYDSPYGSEGRYTITSSGGTLTPYEYAKYKIIISNTAAGTYIFPPVSIDDNTYFKVVENATASLYNVVISNGPGSVVSIAAGTSKLLEFCNTGVRLAIF